MNRAACCNGNCLQGRRCPLRAQPSRRARRLADLATAITLGLVLAIVLCYGPGGALQ